MMWHELEAKAALERWYADWEMFLAMAKISMFTRKDYNKLALKAKTWGIVYHDRYKLLLDARRKYEDV